LPATLNSTPLRSSVMGGGGGGGLAILARREGAPGGRVPGRPSWKPERGGVKDKRPTSPLQTEAFQSGLITQVSSVTTLLFSPSWRLMCDIGMPEVVPSRSRIDRVFQEPPPRLSLSNLGSMFGK